MEQVVSVTLTGVGRTKISRVRAVKDGLLVADGWNPVLDDVPDASYKHQLQVIPTETLRNGWEEIFSQCHATRVFVTL